MSKRIAVETLWRSICSLYAESLGYGGTTQDHVDQVLNSWKSKNPEFDREDYSLKVVNDTIEFSESFTMLFDEAKEEVARG